MWNILASSPELLYSVVLYVLIMATLLISAFLKRDREPSRDHGQPLSPMDYQPFRSPDARCARVDLNQHLSLVQDSCYIEYARMFAEVSRKIRLHE
jgi:hypothetical protein